MLQEVDDKNYIDLTIGWIKENYIKMNAELFDGKLGDCNFNIFTTGRGSEGHTLGRFCMAASRLYVLRGSRRIVKENYDGRVYINKENFYELAKPVIELNGNYKWTYKAALSTLVHEMCHYYCNQEGWRPTNCHGYEFQAIAARVSRKSDNIFTVERIARAEQMDEMELDSKLKAKKEKRQETKVNSIIPTILWMTDGTVRLINCNCKRLLNDILILSKDKIKRAVTGGPDFAKFLFEKGYRNTMRTYRYWDVTSKDWLQEIGKFDLKEVPLTQSALMESIESTIDEVIGEEMEDDVLIPIPPTANLGIIDL